MSARYLFPVIVSLFVAQGVNSTRAQGPQPTVVGSISGSFSVSLSGSSTYSVPIKIPPGTAGTVPKIALVYDSQSLGGALGAGWSISGLSVITRGPKDVFTDGFSAGVNLDDNDALYLDGQRIIPISVIGAGADRKVEYRKAVDDQTRILQVGQNFENCYFRVETKGGVTILFNGERGSRVKLSDGITLLLTESAAIDTAGNTLVKDPSGNSTTNVAGNYVEFSYDGNGVGNYDISSIKYTGHGKLVGGRIEPDPSHLPFASINFTYEKVRAIASYISGHQIVRDVRLTEIATKLSDLAGLPISRYKLDYEDRNTSNRFVLKTLHQYGSDGRELQPTNFEYTKPPLGWVDAGYQFPNSVVLAGRNHLGAGYRFKHFAPVGHLPDLLFSVQVEGKLESFAFRNDLDASAPASPTWTLMNDFKPPIAFANADGADLGVIVEDVRGKGQVSLLQGYQKTGESPTYLTYSAGAKGFDRDDPYKLPFVVSLDGKVVANYHFAKFSGGVGPDLVYESQGVTGFLKNTGTGWQSDPAHAPPVPLDDRVIIIDIDCTGKPAILSSVRNAFGTFDWKIFRYTADGWPEEKSDKLKPLFPANTNPAAIRQAIFSKGGCPGLIVATAGGAKTHAAYVTSTGGWKPIDEKKPPFDFDDSAGNNLRAVVADVNGDGLPDAIAHVQLPDGSEEQYSYLQTPSGWDAAPDFSPPLLFSLKADTSPHHFFVGNIDGKFGDDLIVLNDTATTSESESIFGNVFISNGLKFVLQVSYAPPVQFSRKDKQDRGVRILDLHGRNLPDVIFRRDVTQDGKITSVAGAYRNTGAGWVDEPGLKPPSPLASDDIASNPVQFADVSGGGFADMIYSFRDKSNKLNCHLYRNIAAEGEARKWSDVAVDTPELSALIPPTCKATDDGKIWPIATSGIGDMGVRILKLNDQRLAMLVGFLGANPRSAAGKRAPAKKCTKDATGIEHCDWDWSRLSSAAYIYDGAKWMPAPSYAPPVPFVAQVDSNAEPSQDLFVQLVDVNQDGLPDIVARFKHPHDDTLEVEQVWLNTGNGWRLDPTMRVPYPLDAARREAKTVVQWADVNGDGISDIVLSKRDGATNSSSTWLGTGKGWESSPNPNWQIPLAAISDKDGDPGFRLVDTKGDGFLDVLYARQNDDLTYTTGIFINNGTDWKTSVTGDAVPKFSFVDKDNLDQGVRIMSVTGRGLSDIVQSFAGDVPKVRLNTARRAEMLKSINEGTGLRTTIHYRSLSENDDIATPHNEDADVSYTMPKNLLGSRVYERGTPDPFPLIAPVPTTYVVRRATVDEGPKRSASTSYRYGNYRVDNSAVRSLGFGWRESLNEVSGVLLRSELLQDARFQNSSKREAACWLPLEKWPSHPEPVPADLCPADDSGSQLPDWEQKLSETRNCWLLVEGDTAHSPVREVRNCWNLSPAPITPTTKGSPYKIRQLNLASVVTTQFELDRKLISQGHDTFVYDAPVDVLVRRMNVISTKSELIDGSSIETINEYEQDVVDDSRWFLGRLTKSIVKKVGDPVSIGSPARQTEKRSSSFAYDEATGLLLKQVTNAGDPKQVSTSYKRDIFGNILETSVTADGEKPRITKVVYDDRGRFATLTINPLGQIASKTIDDRTGLPDSATDLNKLVTRYEYDGFARLRRQVNPDGIATTTSLLSPQEIRSTISGYDVTADLADGQNVAFGILTQVDSLPPKVTLFDSRSRPIRAVTDGYTGDGHNHRYIRKDSVYDLLGRVLKASLPYEEDQTPIWSTNFFDVMGRTYKTVSPDGLITITEYRSRKNREPHAAAHVPAQTCADLSDGLMLGGGEVEVTIDPAGLARRSYSCINMRKQVLLSVDGKKGSVKFEYDAGGRLKKMIGATGATTVHLYDELGNRTETSDPDLGVWQYQYDPFGQVVRQIDAKNQISTVEYDVLGRIVRRQENDLTTFWHYDQAAHGAGEIASVEQSNGYRENYSYDALGRPKSIAVQIGREQFVTWTDYDQLGRPGTLYYPTGFAVRNRYDSKGFLVGVEDTRARKDFWTAKDIDKYGRVSKEVYGNGAVTTRTFYERNGRPKNIESVTAANKHILDLSLQYDLVGNLKVRKESVEKKHERFNYDALDRLDEMTDSSGNQARYTFDAAGRITFKHGVGTYHYAGHQGETEGDYAKPFHAVLETTSEDAVHRFHYDRNGNMVDGPQGRFEYTTDNRVSLIYTEQNNWTRFDYGPAGDRFRQFVRKGTQSIETLYVGKYERVVEYASSVIDAKFGRLTRNRHYLSNNSGVFAVVETDAQYADSILDFDKFGRPQRLIGESIHKQVWYLHSDQLGSILRITDEDGRVRDKVWYDPWGARKSQIAASEKEGVRLGDSWKRGFTGHEHLDELSLINMNGRMYSAFLSTFTSVDPINQAAADTQTGNGYMYARGNPLRYIDPSGYGLFGNIWHAVTAPVRAVGNAIAGAVRGVGHFFSEAGRWLAENWRTVVIVAAVIVVTVVTAGAAAGVAGAILTGMAAGATGGALSAALYGGNLSDVLAGALTGALIGGVTGGATFGATAAFSGIFSSGSASAIAGQAVVGGVGDAARGGNFGQGLLIGAASAALGAYGPRFDSTAANTAVAAISGGTIAQISGGKFANGAVSGALSYILTPTPDATDDLEQGRNTRTATGSDQRPDLQALADDPTVKAAMDDAWNQSNPNGPGPKQEHGFWIQKDWLGDTTVVPFSNGGATRDQMVPGPTPGSGGFVNWLEGNRTVAIFHTHPNTAAEGYISGPSPPDKRFSQGRGVPGIIQSHDGMYYYGP